MAGQIPYSIRIVPMQFFAAAGQDRFLLDTFFRGKRQGCFLELGASAAEGASNTLFFERCMGWRGLLVASDPAMLAELAARSAATALLGAEPGHLAALLAGQGIKTLDYCAIHDAAAAPWLLAALVEAHLVPAVLSIRGTAPAPAGWQPLGQLGPDCFFRRPEQKRLAQTSVICAVWSGDPKRADLLRGHGANLARQSVPVEPIYVFDGNDRIPPWVKGRAVAAREGLTLYQAWNLALALVETPFVMNLNLDDRLAEDAVETLERGLAQPDVALVAGEWNVTYSQKETDASFRCYPAEELPSIADWERRAPIRTRLGSGTGEQGTYGPATLWRLDAHIGAPRYPWRCPDGTLLRSAADAAWWLVLERHLQKRLLRLPIVIGNYHFHPKEQAQYRALPYDELQLIGQLGVSLV